MMLDLQVIKKNHFIFCFLFLGLIVGCQRITKSDEEKQQDCLKSIVEFEKQEPFSQLESRFFMDQKSRQLLKSSKLKYISTSTETVSKKRNAEIMKFQFFDKNQMISLKSSDETGGFRLEGSNHISYNVYCKVIWDLFARKPVEQKIWVEELDLDEWQKKVKELIDEHGVEEDVTFEKMQKQMEEPDL